MKKVIITTVVLAIALSLAPSVAQAGTVTLVNPGFEGSPYDSGWGSWGATRWEGKWSGQTHLGTNSQGMSDTSGGVGVYQDFGVTNPGENYTYGAYVKTASLTGGNAFTKLEWYDGSGVIGSAIESTKLSGTNDWTLLNIVSAAPGTATYGRLVMNVIGGGSGQDAFFDDASVEFAPIPEPASMLLLGSGLLGLFAFNRKK